MAKEARIARRAEVARLTHLCKQHHLIKLLLHNLFSEGVLGDSAADDTVFLALMIREMIAQGATTKPGLKVEV